MSGHAENIELVAIQIPEVASVKTLAAWTRRAFICAAESQGLRMQSPDPLQPEPFSGVPGRLRVSP